MLQKFLSLRYISLIAVVSLFIGAVLMFLAGAVKTIGAVFIFFFGTDAQSLPAHLNEITLASVGLVQAVDAFLFALVLLIFSYGIYTLFVSNLCAAELEKLPAWLCIKNISDLKTTLIQVIIVILAVNVLEHVIMVGSDALKWETLIIPISIVALALALKLMHPNTGFIKPD